MSSQSAIILTFPPGSAKLSLAFGLGVLIGGGAIGILNSEKTRENLDRVSEKCTLANFFIGCGYFWLACQAKEFLGQRAIELWHGGADVGPGLVVSSSS